MLSRRALAALATAALLASPATALGQSAGDDQYGDPLGGSAPPPSSGGAGGNPGSGSASGSGSGSGSGGSSGSAGAAAAEGARTPESTATAAAERREELPRTGFDAGLAAGLGALMLAGGTTLRLTLRRSA